MNRPARNEFSTFQDQRQELVSRGTRYLGENLQCSTWNVGKILSILIDEFLPDENEAAVEILHERNRRDPA